MPAPSYEDLINSTATKYSKGVKYPLDPALLTAVMHQESGGNPQAQSPAGAVGLMQLMPQTATSMGVTDRTNPAQSIDGGGKYLSQLLQQYNGDERLALAAYNAGPTAVDKYKDVPPFPETQEYVDNILKARGEADPIRQWINNASGDYSPQELYDYFKKAGAGPKTLAKYFPGVTPPPTETPGQQASRKVFEPAELQYRGGSTDQMSPGMSLATFPGRMLLEGIGKAIAGGRNLAEGNIATGGSQVLEGLAQNQLPTTLGPALANPITALASLLGGGAGAAGGNIVASALGANPEQARFSGDLTSFPFAAAGGAIPFATSRAMGGADVGDVLSNLFGSQEARASTMKNLPVPPWAKTVSELFQQAREGTVTPYPAGKGTAPPKRVGSGASTGRIRGGGSVGKAVPEGSLTPAGQQEEAAQAAREQMAQAYQQPLNLQEIRQRLNLPGPTQPAPPSWAPPTPGTEDLRPENIALGRQAQSARGVWGSRMGNKMIDDGVRDTSKFSDSKWEEYAKAINYGRGVSKGVSPEMKKVVQEHLDAWWGSRGRR